MKRSVFAIVLVFVLAMSFAAVAEAGDEVFGLINGYAFTFASGAGAWSTEIVISASGGFAGHYYDSDMGDSGDDYPDGTRYECHFSGTFEVSETIDPYTYKLRLAALNVESDTGAECVIDGVKVVYTDAYGIEGGENFMLYLPGRATADLPEEFLDWMGMPNAWDEIPDTLPLYGLYNVEQGTGFYSFVQCMDGNYTREEALSLVNAACDNAYVADDYDSDVDSEFGLQIHGRHSENFKLLCTWPLLATDGQFYYQVQQYEFVIDYPETGEGHTATSNWYYIHAATGEVISWFITNENNEVAENEMWLAIDFS